MAIDSKTSMASDNILDGILSSCSNGECIDLEQPLVGYDDGARESTIPRGGASFIRTCFNGLNALSGVGTLSIPFALAEGGWLSLLLFLAIALISFYTGLLIKRCMDADTRIRSYPDIGDIAFGHRGRVIVSTFMCLELYLSAVGYLILEGDNLDKLFPNFALRFGLWRIVGKPCFVLLVAAVVLPTTWVRSMGLLAYVSVGGVLASLVVVVSVLWAATVDGVGFHGNGAVVNFSGLPTALGLYTFCYCAHGVFPTIYTSMEDNKNFSKVLLVCFVLCTLNYGAMGVIGYLMYGENAQSTVTLNLPLGRLSSRVATWTTLINPLAKYALMMTPVASAIEEQLKLQRWISASIALRTFLVLSTTTLALSIPFFGYFTALVGSFLSVFVTVFLPCSCYLKIFKPSQVNKVELVLIVAISVFGLSVASIGTCSSLQRIANEF